MSRVVRCQSTNRGDSECSIMEYFVVERDEQTPDILGLREVSVKFGVQVLQNRLTDRWG